MARTNLKDQDFALVQKALCGDQSAYNAIWNLCYGAVSFQIKTVLGNNTRTAIEDVVMEVFEKAFAALPTFTPDYRLASWFSRIARNRALDYYRRAARVKVVSVDAGWQDEEDETPKLQLMDTTPTAEEQYTQQKNHELLLTYIGKLPAFYANVMRKRYADGYEIEEIAEEMQCTPRDVRHYLRRGERKLKKLFVAAGVVEV